jgi:CheY-like chemotaxis protein
MLERLGHGADVACDGREAVEAVRRHPYDLVFMDLGMPEMDGYEATRRIRAQRPPGRGPWIVALTAHARPEDRQACIAAGMDDFVSKPISLQSLRHALEHYQPPAGADAEAEAGADAAAGRQSDAAASDAAATTVPVDPIDADAWAELDAMLDPDDPSTLRELIGMYHADADRLLAEIRRAHADRDAEALRRAAHGLRSPSASLGALGLAGICSGVEDAMRQDPPLWSAVAIDALVKEVRRVSDALEERCPASRR